MPSAKKKNFASSRRAAKASPRNAVLPWIHARLRTRYYWVVPLAVVLAAAGAYCGAKLGKQQYTSTAQIRIEPVLLTVLKPDEDKGMMPMYESFVDAQIALIRGQRVMDRAMHSPEWKNLGRGFDDDAARAFVESMRVSHEGEIISVSMTDTDANAAVTAAQTVVAAYRRLYLEDDSQNGERRLELLQQRQSAISNEVNGLRSEIKAVADVYGTEELGALFSEKLSEVSQMEAALKDVQLALVGQHDTVPKAAPVDPQLSIEEIGLEDGIMAGYLKSRDELQAQLAKLAKRYGEKSDILLGARQDLDALNQTITERAGAVRAMKKLKVTDTESKSSSKEDLKSRQTTLEAAIAKGKAELIEIGKQNMKMTSLKEDAEAAKARLAETRSRIEQLNIESALAGRISVISDGDRPLAPSKDTRRTYAAAAAVLGIVLAIGSGVLLGLVDGRVMQLEDARTVLAPYPVLGVLPELSQGADDLSRADVAVNCVNRIRTRLQIQSDAPRAPVFTITSPTAGNGKSSLALALGRSFAAAHARTLLIDCDIIGQGLTTRLAAQAPVSLERVLRRERMIKPEQLDKMIALAKSSGRSLSATILESGLLNESKLAGAADRRKASLMGLIDALTGADLKSCVLKTATKGLFVMPAGTINEAHAGILSPHTLRRVIASARKVFDVILIDTGPIMGSVAAPVAAVSSDGVVLTISRGENRQPVADCLRFTESLSVPVLGFVFNRISAEELLALENTLGSSSPVTGKFASRVRAHPRSPEDQENESPDQVAKPLVSQSAGAEVGSLL